MRCEDCLYFNREKKEVDNGYCHRYPPIKNNKHVTVLNVPYDGFPVVYNGDWCGEFKDGVFPRAKVKFGYEVEPTLDRSYPILVYSDADEYIFKFVCNIEELKEGIANAMSYSTGAKNEY